MLFSIFADSGSRNKRRFVRRDADWFTRRSRQLERTKKKAHSQ